MGSPFFTLAFRLPQTATGFARTLVCCLALLGLSACAGNTPSAEAAPPVSAATGAKQASPLPDPAAALKHPPHMGATPPVAACWLPLMQRLAADGLDSAYLHVMFARMGDSYSSLPMGTKITELFTRKYLRQPPPPPDPTKKPDTKPRIYRNVVTETNIARCKAYLLEHSLPFSIEEKLYGVPKEIVVALLMIETKLGTYLGKDNAFWSLACMAAADAPDRVSGPLKALPMTPERMDWVSQRLRERSTWAYAELKSLITHTSKHDLDPLSMPGSIYGAIGICQFMPSNLRPYAVDGNADGKIDLFDPPDAILSVGSYLKGHGWHSGMTRAGQHTALMRYNKSTVYANTILALADAINPPTPPAAKAKPAKKQNAPAPKTTPAKKPAVKTTPAPKKPAVDAGKAAPAKAPATKPTQARPAPAKPPANGKK